MALQRAAMREAAATAAAAAVGLETAARAEVAKVVAVRDWVKAVAAWAAARGMAWVAAARAAAAEVEADDSAERSEGSAVCVPKESDRKGA